MLSPARICNSSMVAGVITLMLACAASAAGSPAPSVMLVSEPASQNVAPRVERALNRGDVTGWKIIVEELESLRAMELLFNYVPGAIRITDWEDGELFPDSLTFMPARGLQTGEASVVLGRVRPVWEASGEVGIIYTEILDPARAEIELARVKYVDAGFAAIELDVRDGPATLREQPSETALLRCQPNPFNPTTAIRFSISADSYVSLKVFDVTGRLVRELIGGKKRAGYYNAQWDGKDANMHDVGSGIFFVQMVAGEFTATQKIMLAR